MITDPEKDWPEDFAHENGNYINTCYECKEQFRGHKRRPLCRECGTPDWDDLANRKPPEDNKCAHAGCWLSGEMTGYARCMVNKFIPLKKENEVLETQNINLNQDYENLKKLYNDLLESHAKQVVEIKELKKESREWQLLSEHFKAANQVEILESELLKAKERFCQCNENDKTGSTSAMHCNHCGKIEQSETWLK